LRYPRNGSTRKTGAAKPFGANSASTPPTRETDERIGYLDGVRGLAALVVVAAHFAAAFLPALYFGPQKPTDSTVLLALWNSPLYVLWNGAFAVVVFFVLSGFVIARSTQRSATALPVLVATRYLRLTIPILASVLLAAGLLTVFSGFAPRVAEQIGNSWLKLYYPYARQSLSLAFWEGLAGWIEARGAWLNPPLWTMIFEFCGSVGIYLSYRLIDRKYVILLLVSFPLLITVLSGVAWALYLGFPLGALLFEAWDRGVLRRNAWWGIPLILSGLLIGGAAAGSTLVWPLIAFGPKDPQSSLAAMITMQSIGASLLLAGVLASARVRHLLEMRVPAFLGRISFALYLVHFPVLGTLACFIFASLGFSNGALTLALPVYVVTTLVLAVLLTKIVDEPTLALLKIVRRRTRAFGLQRRLSLFPLWPRNPALNDQHPVDRG